MAVNIQDLTIYVICGNAASFIKPCLQSITWAKHVIIVFANSTDNSRKIVSQILPQAKTLSTSDQYNKNFSWWRNLGLSLVTTPWLFYLDTDEVISSSLRKEMLRAISTPGSYNAYVVPRANHFLGQRVQHGGTYPDYVKRLYRLATFKGYQGLVHEEPVFTGELGYLTQDLYHFTHHDLSSMLSKSLVWSRTEAELLHKNHHPPVVWWRFFRMMLTKLASRLLIQKMYLDGEVGILSVVFETFNTYMIYANLWEMQQHDI